MSEIWKAVKGFEGYYEVSNLGNVRSLYRYKKVLSPSISPRNGYLYVDLFKPGIRKHYSVHRLVAMHFCSNPLNKPFVNHLDETRTNNRADNLEWVTHKENCNYGTAIQRRTAHTDYSKRRVNNRNQILKCSKPISQYTQGGTVVRIWKSASECARENGWTTSNIRKSILRNGTAYGFVFKERSDDLSDVLSV